MPKVDRNAAQSKNQLSSNVTIPKLSRYAMLRYACVVYVAKQLLSVSHVLLLSIVFYSR